ncbi:hypothetical protein D9M68_876980 [compost metagenome]
MVIEFASDHFVSGGNDQLEGIGVEQAKLVVGEGRGLLGHAKGVDDFLRHLFPANVEIGKASGRLRTVVLLIGYFDGAHRVRFNAHAHCKLQELAAPRRQTKQNGRPLWGSAVGITETSARRASFIS